MGTDLVEYNKDKRLALWAARIAECRNSDTTIRQWCKEHHLPVATYYHWQRRVFDALQKSSPSGLHATADDPSNDIFELPASLMPSAKEQPILRLNKADLTAEVFAGITPDLMEAICRGLGHA